MRDFLKPVIHKHKLVSGRMDKAQTDEDSVPLSVGGFTVCFQCSLRNFSQALKEIFSRGIKITERKIHLHPL